MIRAGLLAIVATLPLAPYKLFDLKEKLIDPLFKSTIATGLGFLVTAAALIVTCLLKGGGKGPRETTWFDALLIGLAQRSRLCRE